jgi:hypothetical protein
MSKRIVLDMRRVTQVWFEEEMETATVELVEPLVPDPVAGQDILVLTLGGHDKPIYVGPIGAWETTSEQRLYASRIWSPQEHNPCRFCKCSSIDIYGEWDEHCGYRMGCLCDASSGQEKDETRTNWCESPAAAEKEWNQTNPEQVA